MKPATPRPLWARHRDLPVCQRCSRLVETCLRFDAAGCVGAPRPRLVIPTAEQLAYLRAVTL